MTKVNVYEQTFEFRSSFAAIQLGQLLCVWFWWIGRIEPWLMVLLIWILSESWGLLKLVHQDVRYEDDK